MSNPNVGHNGGPVLFDHESIERMHFFKLDIEACLKALRKMPLEKCGFYMKALITMYAEMGGLPADDRMAAMAMGNVDIRTYKRLKNELLAEGLFVDRGSCITNARVEAEITAYVREIRRRRDAALEREEKKRVANATIAKMNTPTIKDQANFGGTSGGSSSDLSGPYGQDNPIATQQVSRKVNEINGSTATAVAQPWHNSTTAVVHLDLDIERKKEGSTSDPLTLSLELPLSETRVSDGVVEASRKAKRNAYSDAYEAFWKSYPDTAGMSKIEGWNVWRKLSAADQAQAAASVPAWKAQLSDRRKTNPSLTTLHVQGFLNQRRFETLPVGGSSSSAEVWWMDPLKFSVITDEQWKNSIRKYANGMWPVDKLGPAPGNKLCRVPPRLIAEWRIGDCYDERGLKRRGVPDLPFANHH